MITSFFFAFSPFRSEDKPNTPRTRSRMERVIAVGHEQVNTMKKVVGAFAKQTLARTERPMEIATTRFAAIKLRATEKAVAAQKSAVETVAATKERIVAVRDEKLQAFNAVRDEKLQAFNANKGNMYAVAVNGTAAVLRFVTFVLLAVAAFTHMAAVWAWLQQFDTVAKTTAKASAAVAAARASKPATRARELDQAHCGGQVAAFIQAVLAAIPAVEQTH